MGNGAREIGGYAETCPYDQNFNWVEPCNSTDEAICGGGAGTLMNDHSMPEMAKCCIVQWEQNLDG
jgi:hypothetical protein